ncbi:MAG TPA: hypothetical protein VMF89_29165, partial [Polyangiales bacterium]|nr:hypothetical protein [Polyangiales bacterium]
EDTNDNDVPDYLERAPAASDSGCSTLPGSPERGFPTLLLLMTFLLWRGRRYSAHSKRLRISRNCAP